MTGFGRGESGSGDTGGMTVVTEIRSVNSRFLETSVRLPRTLSEREFEIREMIRKSLERGKISVSIAVNRTESSANVPLAINENVARGYYALLDRLRNVTGVTAEITLRDLTSYNDIFTTEADLSAMAAEEWRLAQDSLRQAIDALNAMRKQEGGELEKDIRSRLALLDERVTEVEKRSADAAQTEYAKVKERVAELVADINVINNDRLELEIALLAERLDITEEIVRFRSHLKFFLEALDAPEPAGRKLNFLLQEMNREINTMASKTSIPAVAHIVVGMKEELEKMREQAQNIE
jgi:uncharacterized protein (TIGR00255 family)